ncbi:MAG: AarF/ABC1/UbiB kinase family protein [Deltaproteobacteria bacterium]|nr:AarF/ABC1/UbiB kinase family protein [Deltaproteobacteria bacterium]
MEVAAPADTAETGRREPHDHEEEIIIEQKRPIAGKASKYGQLCDPDALSVLEKPNYSGIPADPEIKIPRNLRPNPARLSEILGTLAKHGIFMQVERMLDHPKDRAFARRLRMAFEELGPTFIKLGQMIASSPGIFPETISDEFLKCLDRVPPFPYSEVKRILREELGDDYKSRFRNIDVKPIAAASIAQVHFAELADGTPVVIKVQRPGIKAVVERDVGILFLIAKMLVRFFRNAHLASPVDVVSDFNITLHEELDFRLEANSMEKFNAVFASAGNKRIYAAKVHREHSTRRVLVMERLSGARVDDIKGIRKLGADPEDALRLGVKAVLRTMMLHGFFHGDVHAGNLLITPDNGVHFMDFGIVGRQSVEKSKLMTHLLVSMMAGTYENLSDVLIKLGSAPENVNRSGLTSDIKNLMREFKDSPLGEINFGDLLTSIVQAAVKNNVRLPREFILLVKQMVYFDRYAHLLAPDLNIFEDRFLIDFLWRDPQGRERYPQMQMIGMLQNVRSVKDLRNNKQRSFNELPERYRGRYRYMDGTPITPNELQCVVCNIVIIAKRPFQAGDRAFCQPCGTKMVVIEKDGKLTAEPIYSPDAQAVFQVTENLQDFAQ